MDPLRYPRYPLKNQSVNYARDPRKNKLGFCRSCSAHTTKPMGNSSSSDHNSSSSNHGNAGYKVKHLRHTSNCRHYEENPDWKGSNHYGMKCATHGCPSNDATNDAPIFACHVVMGNQGNDGNRYLIYACNSCNKTFDQTVQIRANAKTVELTKLTGCFCGHLEKCGQKREACPRDQGRGDLVK
jgi:hypothetical protein